jgi:hypothetical protein
VQAAEIAAVAHYAAAAAALVDAAIGAVTAALCFAASATAPAVTTAAPSTAVAVHAAAPVAATAAAVQRLDFLRLQPPAELSYPHWDVCLRHVAAFWLIALRAAECSPVASLLLARLAAVLQRAVHAELEYERHDVGFSTLSIADMLLAAST